MNRRALSAVCFLSLAACTQERALPLRIGANNWPGYGPLFLATETGLLSHHDAELVDLPSATEVMYGLKHGLLDGAALTLDESLTLLAEGTPVEVVAVLDVSDGADAIVAHAGLAQQHGRQDRRHGHRASHARGGAREARPRRRPHQRRQPRGAGRAPRGDRAGAQGGPALHRPRPVQAGQRHLRPRGR